jgi:hypothetical protein
MNTTTVEHDVWRAKILDAIRSLRTESRQSAEGRGVGRGERDRDRPQRRSGTEDGRDE